jgi:hypothetical protein
MSPIPARDSKSAVVTRTGPPKAPDALVKFPGKLPPVKFPVNVLVNVVKVAEDEAPVTNRREGFPIITRTSPTATSATLASTSLLTKRLRAQDTRIG